MAGALSSCLMLPCARNHYFVPTNDTEKDSIKITVFSTPKHKYYVVTNIDLNAQVSIKSSIFENPNKFYLMENQDFFEEKAKQYIIAKRDRKYYRNDDYKKITLKIVSEAGETMISYQIAGQ